MNRLDRQESLKTSLVATFAPPPPGGSTMSLGTPYAVR